MGKFIAEIFRYGVVGVSSGIVDFLVYVGLTRAVHFPELAANLGAYLAGHVVSFFGNRAWTFRSNGHAGYEYLRFWAVNLIGLGVSSAVLWIGLRFGIHDLYVKVAAIILSGAWNFIMNRVWTFRPQVR